MTATCARPPVAYAERAAAGRGPRLAPAIPEYGGTVSHQAARDELWARFSTAAPQRLRQIASLWHSLPTRRQAVQNALSGYWATSSGARAVN